MSPVSSFYQHHILLATSAVSKCLDAKSLATDYHGVSVYSSPNMSFVPEPHVGEEELRARADGRFGTADCFQWPQLFCDKFPYAVCIPRKEYYVASDPESWAWYRPTLEDFETLPHSAFRVGSLKQEKALGVAGLHRIASTRYNGWKETRGTKQDIAGRMVKSLEHDTMLLFNHPLTFRDITVYVAQAQRYFLDIMAFLDYVTLVQPRIAYPSGPPFEVQPYWMGCFTWDTSTCNDLFHAGVPVWLIRSRDQITSTANIQKRVKFTFPDDIVRGMYTENGKSVRPFVILHHGPSCFLRHFHTRRPYMSAAPQPPGFDLSSESPQPSSQVGKTPMRAQSGRAKQTNGNRPKPGK